MEVTQGGALDHPDVYICCAPEELEFARFLEDMLRLGGRKPFLGGLEAEAAEDPRLVETAIDAAGSFVFVISPASVTSPRCRAQLSRAAKRKKRLVAIIRGEVQARDLPKPIASVSPILFRENDDREAALQALVLELHTRFTVDVFICYSRKDKKFVDRLYEAIKRAGKRSWLDVRSIPLLAKWKAEIETGIEAAEHFIFILSPDSVASKECQRELEYALSLRKRLVPVRYRNVPDAEVPSALGEIQHIPVQDDDFDTAFKGLLAALDTDLEHVRAHTRLLVRALEWEKQRDSSLLLQGKELEAAESWLVTEVPRSGPQPTHLHKEYIRASRQVATRNLRLLLAAVTAGLLITIALLLTAIYQYAQKEQQRRTAVSRQLAAQANEQRPRHLDLALLLGVESFAAEPTVEARSALLAALRHSPALERYLHGHDHQSRIGRVAFSSDGKWFASASHDGSVVLWEHPAMRALAPELPGTGGFVEGLAFSADGQLLASASEDGAIRIWKTADRTLACDPLLKVDGVPLTSLAFSPKGRLLAAGGFAGEIRLWDVDGCRLLEEPSHPARGPVHQVAFSPQGDRVATGHGDGSVLLWSVGSDRLEVLGSPLAGDPKGVIDLAFSPDSQSLVAGGMNGGLRLWSVNEPERPPMMLVEHGARILSVAFSPDGRMVASGDSEGRLRLWNVQWRVELPPLAPERQVWLTALAFSPDGKRLVAGSRDGVLAVWNLEAYWAAGAHGPLGRRLTGQRGQLMSFAFSPDAATLASGSLDGDVVLWNPRSVQQPPTARPCSSFEEARSLAFHPHRGELAVAVEGTVVVLDAQRCEPTGRMFRARSQEETLMGIAYSPDGTRLLAGSYSGAVYIWEVTTGTEQRIPPRQEVTIVAVAFSPDGKSVAMGDNQGGIILVEPGEQGRIRRLDKVHGTSSSSALAFSPDSRLLISGGDDGTVRFCDARSGTGIGPLLRGQAERAFSVAFSGDGQTAASGHEDGTLVLWDVMTHQPVGLPFKGHDGFVTALAFTPDGASLVSGDESGAVLLWDVRTESWQARACRIANRDFWPEEGGRHFDNEQFHSSCQHILAQPE